MLDSLCTHVFGPSLAFPCSSLGTRGPGPQPKPAGSSGQHLLPFMAHVGEVDARKLYLRSACSSMFAYCTDVLHLSEGATCKRIHAARAARKHPLIFELVAAGKLHLSAVCLLAPHLSADNCDELLEQATGCTKRQVEKLLARRLPKPDVKTPVRALPQRRGAGRSRPAGTGERRANVTVTNSRIKGATCTCTQGGHADSGAVGSGQAAGT